MSQKNCILVELLWSKTNCEAQLAAQLLSKMTYWLA